MTNTMKALMISVMSMIWPLISILPGVDSAAEEHADEGQDQPRRDRADECGDGRADDDGDREVDEVALERELPESLEHDHSLQR